MIKGLTAMDEHITVSSGGYGYPTITPQNPIPGSIKIDYSGTMSIFDGQMWQVIPASYISVGISNSSKETLEWAQKKMLEERKIEEEMTEAVVMAKTNPTVADALESYKEIKEQCKAPQKLAWEKLKAIMALCKEETK